MAVFTLRIPRPVHSKCICVVIVIAFLYILYHWYPPRKNKCSVTKWKLFGNYPIHGFRNDPPIESSPQSNIILNTIHPNISSTDQHAFWIIHSSSENFRDRQFVRSKYFKKIREAHIIPIFVVLRSNLSDIGQKVQEEYEQHNDMIIVDNVIDSYHNITQKVRAWVTFLNNNHKPTFVIKTDDDIMIDWDNTMPMLEQLKLHKNVILCRIYRNGQVVRNAKSKWYLSKQEYKNSTLGSYCQGMAMAFSGNLIDKMATNTHKVQYLWMDDWYLSRALLNGTNTLYIDMGSHYLSTNSMAELKDFFRNPRTILFAHFRRAHRYDLNERKETWDQVKQAEC